MRKLFTLLLLFLSSFIFAQNKLEVEGIIVDKVSSEPIPYANIYNATIEKGTISNSEGYFRIPINSPQDSIRITFIGYKDYLLKINPKDGYYKVFLEENIHSLGEITVTPQENNYLFELVEKCRKNASSYRHIAKACFDLKTYSEDSLVEHVEAYFNAEIEGYGIEKLNLKAGRIALRPVQNRFIVSLESSHAILMLKLMEKGDKFPFNPLQMSIKKLKKSYYLDLDRKYLNEGSDTIYVLDYLPKKEKDSHFKGQIFINKSQNTILKIILKCENAFIYPFISKPHVEREKVNFNITYSFTEINNYYIFTHVDFEYTITSKNISVRDIYTNKTKAILYAYNYKTPFQLPLYNISEKAEGDYREISSIPYNDFFWNTHDEYKLNDSLNSAVILFNDSLWLNNINLFSENKIAKRGFFEHPFTFWSPNRIIIKENIPEPKGGSVSPGFVSDKYNLAVKFYVNRDVYADSINIITLAVFDPFDSFYHLPIDKNTLCFINIYFDLCEIERRSLSKKINAAKNDFNLMTKVYNEFLLEMENKKSKYMKDVDRGLDLEELEVYNEIVLKELGIDNFEIFKIYDSEEQ